MPKKLLRTSDQVLRDTLRKAYLARAKLFVAGLRKSGVDELTDYLSQQNSDDFRWNLVKLGISKAAHDKVAKAAVEPHLVFCHPDLVRLNKKLISYYRNLAALSRKGLSQMLAGLSADERASECCRVFNGIVSSIIEEMPVFDLALARSVIPVEIGAEVQGTWVNLIGRGAAKRVEQMISQFAAEHEYLVSEAPKEIVAGGKKRKQLHLLLKNGWTIVFGDEPDISIRDGEGVLRSAVEVKGSMDRAGAQTRYGEAKKSFAKALREYAQCETIYLASCFTQSVMNEIRTDAQVRKTFNLIDIFEDSRKRREFLEELFDHIIRLGQRRRRK